MLLAGPLGLVAADPGGFGVAVARFGLGGAAEPFFGLAEVLLIGAANGLRLGLAAGVFLRFAQTLCLGEASGFRLGLTADGFRFGFARARCFFAQALCLGEASGLRLRLAAGVFLGFAEALFLGEANGIRLAGSSGSLLGLAAGLRVCGASGALRPVGGGGDERRDRARCVVSGLIPRARRAGSLLASGVLQLRCGRVARASEVGRAGRVGRMSA